MIIPGWIVSLLTFPGVIVHELAHKIGCKLAGLKVEKVCYFRFGNPAGYVIHEAPKNYNQALLASAFPLLLNTVATALAAAIAILFTRTTVGTAFSYLAIAFGMHAFPSDHDADGIWTHAKRVWKTNFFAVLGFPIVVLIKIANLLRFLWFDLIYALLVFAVTATLLAPLPIYQGSAFFAHNSTFANPTFSFSYPSKFAEDSQLLEKARSAVSAQGNSSQEVVGVLTDGYFFARGSIIAISTEKASSGNASIQLVADIYNKSLRGDENATKLAEVFTSITDEVPVEVRNANGRIWILVYDYRKGVPRAETTCGELYVTISYWKDNGPAPTTAVDKIIETFECKKDFGK